MKTLIIDTALGACTVVAAAGPRVVAHRTEVMTRGHQERLGALVREVMGAAGWTYDDLERVAVTTGPGSFTGLRVGLAFAQGMGVALNLPVTGLSTLAALARDAEARTCETVWALIDARRGQVYGQPFRKGASLAEAAALDLETAARRMMETDAVAVIGSGAGLIDLEGVTAHICVAPSPEALASLAAEAPGGEARPIYLRAPDAKLPGGRDPE